MDAGADQTFGSVNNKKLLKPKEKAGSALHGSLFT